MNSYSKKTPSRMMFDQSKRENVTKLVIPITKKTVSKANVAVLDKAVKTTNLAELDEAIPPEVRIGYWAIAAFLALLLFWGASVPLATGAIAPGVVSVEGNSKTIQHLKGGRINEILVKDGDLVTQGQTLLRLEKTQIEAKYSALKSQYILLLARDARLKAESNTLSSISYSNWLIDRKDDPEVVEAMNSQERIFHSNLDLLREKEITYSHRIAQAKTLMVSNRSRLSSNRARINSVNSELANYQQLLAQGLVTRSQTFSLESTKGQTQDQIDLLQGNINSSQGLISQYKAEISEYKILQKNQAAKELDKLQDQISSVQKDLNSEKDLLAQTDIQAPISGYIVNLKTNTIGGVIAPGQNIMEIVPNNKRLMITARVEPKDRNSIAVGQNAEVRFSAFNRRSTLPIKGEVLVVSADRLIDAVTNTPYYNTTIELLEDPAIKLSGATIYPGMQTEVIINTGKRTAADYVLSPLTQSFNRALREN